MFVSPCSGFSTMSTFLMYLLLFLGCPEVETKCNGNWWTANWSYLFMHGKVWTAPEHNGEVIWQFSLLVLYNMVILPGLQKVYTCLLALPCHKGCYGLSTAVISQLIIYDAGMLFLPSYSLFELLPTVPDRLPVDCSWVEISTCQFWKDDFQSMLCHQIHFFWIVSRNLHIGN